MVMFHFNNRYMEAKMPKDINQDSGNTKNNDEKSSCFTCD